MTSHSFSYCEHCCSQSFFFYSCSAEKLPLRTSTLKVIAFKFFTNKIKIKKVLFSKKKKERKKKRDLTSTSYLDLTFLLTLQALQPALFSAAAAREAREAALRAASRLSALLAAASRFCCSIHGNCSASRTKSQILQPCDPGQRPIFRLEPGPSRARHFPRDMLLLTTTALLSRAVVVNSNISRGKYIYLAYLAREGPGSRLRRSEKRRYAPSPAHVTSAGLG